MRHASITLCLAGCAAAPEARDAPLRAPVEDVAAAEHEVETPRDWLSVGFSILNRGNDETSDVSDAIGFSLDGGYALTDGELRPSLEVGGTYSSHDVQGESDEIDLFRLSFGMRLTWFPESGIVSPYVRSGGFYRWNNESEFDVEPLDQDGTGWYAGTGIDFLTSDGTRLGPFVQYYRGADEDDLEELLVGIAATITY